MSSKPKSTKVIAADIDATRDRLLGTVSELKNFVKPATVANRGLAKATGFFVSEDGKARPERIAAVAAAAVGLLGLMSRRRD
ncbi:MAG: DUF3618 domain-containing protein [Actinomycetes bacterium]